LKRLKQLRLEIGLTQGELAKLLNVELAAISKYETGRVQLKEDYIKILSDFFNVSSDYLLGNSNIRDVSKHNSEGTLFGKVYSKIKKMDEEELKFLDTLVNKLTKDNEENK